VRNERSGESRVHHRQREDDVAEDDEEVKGEEERALGTMRMTTTAMAW
jgi:hypothetical protein